jgi:hypothetical protein
VSDGVPVTNLVDDLNEYCTRKSHIRAARTRAYLSTNLDRRYYREYSVEGLCSIEVIEVDGEWEWELGERF